jgi:hypothetical protein
MVLAAICSAMRGSGRLLTAPVTGSLPSGREIARQCGRHERWGRLVKRSGTAGELALGREPAEPGLRLVGQQSAIGHQ